MASSDRQRWNARHQAARAGYEPSPFVRQVLEKYDIQRGPALDVATGQGRNALFLAARGFQVTAFDIAPAALMEARRRSEALGLSVDWREADLERVDLPPSHYRLAVNVDYLQRSLTGSLIRSLLPGGFVIFDTYLVAQREIGRPRNPDYLLQPGELFEMFAGFRVLAYREGKFFDRGAPEFRAGIFARKPF